VQQRYVFEVGKSITFVLHIMLIYSVPNIVKKWSTHADTTVNETGLFFLTHTVCLLA